MNKRELVLLKKISKEAVRLDWEKAFNGKAKGNKHLFRVNKIAKFLQKREGGNLFLILTSAWVHDVSLAYDCNESEKNINKNTRQFLSQFNLLPNEINKIAQYSSSHESGRKNIPIEAKIVHDSYVIDKGGILGIIRHVWKMTNLLEKRILSNKEDLAQVKKHLKERERKVFTKTSKKIVKRLNKKRDEFFTNEDRAIELMNQISIKANKGINSDKIALFLIKTEKIYISEILRNQLDCSYLNLRIKENYKE